MIKEKTVKTGNWFQRHKILTVILGIVALFIIIGIATGGSKVEVSTPTSNQSTSTEQPVEQEKEKFTISNTSYSENGGLKQVIGEFTNNDATKRSASLKATFYNTDGSIKGTALGFVNDVAPGETKTFNLLTTDDVAGYSDLKVQVDSSY